MDITVILGTILACGLLVMSIGTGSEAMMTFIQPESLMFVFGGTLGASLMHFPSTQIFKMGGRLKVFFSLKKMNYTEDIDFLVNIATKYNESGPNAILEDIEKCNDHYLKISLQILIDDVDERSLQKFLSENLNYIEKRHEQGIMFFEQMAKYAPAFGLLGTVVGLVKLLKVLQSNPELLGISMAMALITTFYGVLLANLVFQPLAGRLRSYSIEETLQKMMVIIVLCVNMYSYRY